MTSAKQLELIKLYTQMASDGYQTIDEKHIENAFSDMEIRAFKQHVKLILQSFNVKTLLDYGCGGSDYELPGFHGEINAINYFNLEEVFLYEPARNKDERRIADAVVCFDVLEHIFISDVPRVIRELFSLAKHCLIINVACYPASALLPNGENAHITVRPPLWWKGMFDAIAIEYPNVTLKLFCSTGWRKVEAFNLIKASDWLEQSSFTVNI